MHVNIEADPNQLGFVPYLVDDWYGSQKGIQKFFRPSWIRRFWAAPMRKTDRIEIQRLAGQLNDRQWKNWLLAASEMGKVLVHQQINFLPLLGLTFNPRNAVEFRLFNAQYVSERGSKGKSGKTACMALKEAVLFSYAMMERAHKKAAIKAPFF